MQKILDNYAVNIYNFSSHHVNDSVLNQHVDKVYVINLKKDTLRRNYIICLMNKFKINFTLVLVDKIDECTYSFVTNKTQEISKEELGCTLSHLWCLNNIICNKYNNAIIFEDDIIFHKQFSKLFLNIFKKEYNFLLLGACDFCFSEVHKNNIINNLYAINNTSNRVYGAHANYYSLIGATKMFDIKMKYISFFDKDYSIMFEYFKTTAFICYPNLIVSDITTTNLKHTYDLFSITEFNYYKKCFINFSFEDYHFIYLSVILESKNIKIEKNETYKKYIHKILYHYFYNNEKITKIMNRIDVNLFTIDELKYIMKGI